MSTESTATSTPTTDNTATAAPQPQAATAVKKASTGAKKATRRPIKKAAKPTVRKAPSKTQGSTTQKTAPQAAKPKTVASKPAKPAQPAKPKQNAEQKPKKPKLVRDSFTFPKDEYQAIAGLKQKALGLKHSAKKSEILRAGLMLLNGLNDKAFLAALSKVPALKTGRPAKS
jgi:hypothetical protein